MKINAVIILALLLSACSSGLDRKLDGSSESAFAATLAGMKKSSKPEEVAKLDQALLALAITDVSIGYEGGILGALDKLSAAKTPEQLADVLMAPVDGKTGRELIVMGQKRKKAEAAKQLAKIDAELMQLRAARDQRVAATGVLDKIQVLEPSLGFSSVASQRSSMIEFTVKNGSDLPLSQLFLRGVAVESTGDKILFADDINYKLSERLAPGESKTIRLPNMDPGKWNSLEVWGRNNLLFTVELVNAESQPGEKLAPAFSNKDAQRLTVLEKSKPLLEKMLAE